MAEYNINFSTNASQIAKELSKVQTELAKAVQMAKPSGLKIQLSLDASGLEESINTTFRKINKAIESNQRKLSRLQIGGANFRMIAERLGTAEGQRERGRAIAEPIRLRAQAAAFEPGSLTSMQKVLQALRIEASQITPNTVEWVRFQQRIGEVTLELKQADKAAESIQLTQQLGALQPGSLSRLEKQLTILKNRAREIAPNTIEWKKLNKEIQNVETSIAKVNKKPMTMGQRAGAAGGAFLYGGGLGGGAGSALGGIAGGLAGGVPGAFTGAALGQLADNIGQALGATASYTAEIDKQRLALKNVTKDVAEYENALAFIDKTSRNLAIPQDVLNKQFTQLSASVIGAGGDINLAQEAFIGIAAGIRGTGGSLADMEGALRATAQVFSKGKVSAEELRQQIGERLPGAFTLFAKSMGKTPQELDKMLEQGQVTLNDFMSFVRNLSSEYGASASEIAASSQAAGDRLATTMSRMRESVGRELQPLGAQFQEILARAVADNEGNLVALAKAFSEAAQAIGRFIEQYGGLIASLGSTILLIGGTALAVKGIATAYFAIGPAIATATAAIASYGGALSVAKLAMAGLVGPITLTIAGLVLLGKGVYDTNETFRNFVDNIGGVIASDFKNAVEGMAEDARSSADNIQTAYEDLTTKLEPIGSAIEQFFEDVFGSISNDGKSSASNVDNAFTTAFDNILSQGAAAFSGLSALIGNWWNSLPAPIRNILGGNTASILVGAGAYTAGLPGRTAKKKPGMQGPPAPEMRGPPIPERLKQEPDSDAFSGGSTVAAGAEGSGRAANDARRAAEQAAQAEQRIQDQLRGLKREIELNGQLSVIKELQFKAEMDGNKELQARLQGEERTVQILQATAQSLDGITDERLRQKTLAKAESEITSSQQETMFDMQRIEAERTKAFNEIITGLDLELALRSATTEHAREQLRLEAEMAKLRGQGFTPGEIDAIAARKTELAAPKTAQEYLGEGLEAAEKRLQELTNTGYQVVQAANAIGDAFGTAFKGLVSGSMTAQEALAGMFQSIADHFADMVAQMIAEYLKMALIKGIMSIIGGVAGGLGGGGANLGPNSAAVFGTNSADMMKYAPLPTGYANGGIAYGGFTAFANGGMVTGPTMGLVGEGRYNEAIVPLPDGKSIPVQLAGGDGGNQIVSNITVNVNNGQAQSNATGSNSSEMGRKIEGAVKQVIVGELRPGGLLASKK
jgi:tape measure domain-containing protein